MLRDRTLGRDLELGLELVGVGSFSRKSSAGSLENASFITDSTSLVTSSRICGLTSLIISWLFLLMNSLTVSARAGSLPSNWKQKNILPFDDVITELIRGHLFVIQLSTISRVKIIVTSFLKFCPYVVYFDQRLGAAYPKRWSKSSFSAFLALKSWKMQKRTNLVSNLAKKWIF